MAGNNFVTMAREHEKLLDVMDELAVPRAGSRGLAVGLAGTAGVGLWASAMSCLSFSHASSAVGHAVSFFSVSYSVGCTSLCFMLLGDVWRHMKENRSTPAPQQG